jgi:hypothetical protein
MLGIAGRVNVGSKKDQSILRKRPVPQFSGNSGATNGFASSIANKPLQGMELINPNLLEKKIKDT